MTVRTWSGTVALLGVETGDGRMLMRDAEVSFRSNVGFLGWQKTSGEVGHSGALAIGGYTDAWVEDGAIVVPPGKGFFLDTPEAREAQEYIERGVMSPSIDPDTVEAAYFNAETGKELTEDEFFEALFGMSDTRVVQGYTAFTVAGATLVLHSAFDGVSIVLDPVDEAAAAPSLGLVASVMASAATGDRRKAEVAAGRKPTGLDGDGMPIAYATPFGFEVADGAWFSEPDLDWAMGVHRVTDGPDRGRVQGYIAPRDAAHLSTYLSTGAIRNPPVTQCDHMYFRQTGVTLGDTGERVAVGRLCVVGGHAAPADAEDWREIQRAYDDTATSWAVVMSGDNDLGTWVSGYVIGDTDPRILADGLSAAYSGHWFEVPGQRDAELVAAVGVVTGAFLTPKVAMSSATSGDEPHMRSLLGLGVPASGHPMAARWRDVHARRNTNARTDVVEGVFAGTSDMAAAVVDEMERREAYRATQALVASLSAARTAREEHRAAQLRNLVADIRNRRA